MPGQILGQLGLELTLPWLRRAISFSWLRVDQSPAPTAASLRGEMLEGAEADPSEQPLNSSIDLKSGGEPDDPANGNFRKAAVSKVRAAFIAIVGVLVVIIIALAAALGVEKSKRSSLFPPAASRCPDGWIGIKGKFYYFSNAPRNWTYSQSFCSSHAASLAGVDNLQELGSLLPYKGRLDHWIGLRRDMGQVWKWVNGTEFDRRFQIQGAADCAYLDEDLTVSSSSCSTPRNQICSRPDAPT
ncbi:C-type lectin domain family 2 member D-like isoform X1 [Mauremys reevesii]|uniref:C-type lectin domain family 2 member D-like isoform X1 n=2 Tax=Mauremys reevesii TaxID=260615 RepID=UPI00193FE4FC|nr:C-type lectin domain family 2 member D-like isoform X1 [Mauremys reevesii]